MRVRGIRRLKRKYRHIRKHFCTPVVIFSLGKVGSSSLRSTLKENYDGHVMDVHTYGMLTEEEKNILKWRRILRLPIHVICPVREPVSRNISAFFENFNRDTGFQFSDRDWTSDEILNLFLRHYPHNVCLEWFDRHLRTTFGLDVFSEPFPIEQKWKIYRRRGVRVLVYRTDLDRSTQLELISEFVGYKMSTWVYKNISREKNYGELYGRFTSSLALPDIYISMMCKSSYCRQFWSEEEIQNIKDKFTCKRLSPRGTEEFFLQPHLLPESLFKPLPPRGTEELLQPRLLPESLFVSVSRPNDD